MPETDNPVLSDKGKEALEVLRGVRFEGGIAGQARDDVVYGVCGFYHAPITQDGKLFINSLAPISRDPKLAVGTFLSGAHALEESLKGQENDIKTNFGPLAGLNQSQAKKRLHECVETLKLELSGVFGARYDELVRSHAAKLGGRE